MNTRKPRRATVLAAAVPALALSVATPSPAMADTSSRVALPSPNAAYLLGSGLTVTPLDPGTPLTLRVYLEPQPGLAEVAAAVSDPHSPAYAHFLTAAEYQALFAPTAAESSAVSGWLTSQGMTVTATTPHYLAVTATVAQADTAFDTQVSGYKFPGGYSVSGVVGGFSVPSALGGDILTVTGIDQATVPSTSTGGGGKGGSATATKATAAAATATATATAATVRKTGTARTVTARAMAVKNATGTRTTGRSATGKSTTGKSTAGAGASSSFPCSQYWGEYTGTIPEAYGHTSAPTALCGYTPNQIREAYGISSSPYTGKGATIAIISDDDHSQMQADANEYFASHGLAGFAPGQFRDVILPDVASTCAGVDIDPDPEEPIDVESAHLAAPDADVVDIASGCDSTGNDGTFLQQSLDGVGAVVDQQLANVVSGSFGIAESGDAPADMAAWDPILEQGALEGIGFDFSSGDGGDEADSASGTQFSPLDAQFPATDPWATAIGGTSTAIGADGRVLADYVWGDDYATINSSGTGYTPALPGTFGGGSGGGLSSRYAEPDYQRAGGVPATLATDGGTVRASRVIPDISADAGLPWLIGWTGAVTDGTYNELPAGGGTSASSPLIAGLEADAIQAAGHPLGFVNPLLYSLGGTSAISDVLPTDPAEPPILDGYQSIYGGIDTTQVNVLGQDGTLEVTPGYDDGTGLGTPTTSFVCALARL